MLDWFTQLNTELKITVISTIVTAIISIVSVIIAVLAVKVTKKSILDANRPYVVAYFDVVDVGYYKKYLIIKNYGSTGAQITDIKLNIDFEDNRLQNFIIDCSNRYIAPNQSFKTAISTNEKFSYLTGKDSLFVTIEYRDQIKRYKEVILLHPLSFNNQAFVLSSDPKLEKFENQLINSLHAMNKSQL